MKSYLALISCALLLALGCKTPEARRPKSQSSGSYIDASIARNKELNQADERAIQKIIADLPNREFLASDRGFWYTYELRDTISGPTPRTGDLVTFDYDLQTLEGDVIVPQEDLGPQTYQVDQSNQDLMPGLRDGIKLMKAGETITFLFPSHKAFGYYGLEDKIGSNRPIKSSVTLIDIKPKTSEERP